MENINGDLSEYQKELLTSICYYYEKNEVTITRREIDEYCKNQYITELNEMALFSYLYGVHEQICANANNVENRNIARVAMDECDQYIDVMEARIMAAYHQF